MTQLLVSVRSAAEAAAALAGGAHLIDVKEPAHGPLGSASAAVVADVIGAVGGRVPVSAALGELSDAGRPPLPPAAGLSYVKWGLAGWRNGDDGWRHALDEAASRLRAAAPGCRVVVVAYADWQRAAAPEPSAVYAFARQRRCPLLIDTWGKDGSTLLDWLSADDLTRTCAACREAEVPVALAGSLGPAEIRLLRPAAPDWFAVRGAACRGGRGGAVDADKVRELVALLPQDRISILSHWPTAAG